VIVGGLEKSGVMNELARLIINLTKGYSTTRFSTKTPARADKDLRSYYPLSARFSLFKARFSLSDNLATFLMFLDPLCSLLAIFTPQFYLRYS
jgi:hypothetical protein